MYSSKRVQLSVLWIVHSGGAPETPNKGPLDQKGIAQWGSSEVNEVPNSPECHCHTGTHPGQGQGEGWKEVAGLDEDRWPIREGCADILDVLDMVDI